MVEISEIAKASDALISSDQATEELALYRAGTSFLFCLRARGAREIFWSVTIFGLCHINVSPLRYSPPAHMFRRYVTKIYYYRDLYKDLILPNALLGRR